MILSFVCSLSKFSEESLSFSYFFFSSESSECIRGEAAEMEMSLGLISSTGQIMVQGECDSISMNSDRREINAEFYQGGRTGENHVLGVGSAQLCQDVTLSKSFVSQLRDAEVDDERTPS